jgi:hypothetical protein
VWCLFRWRVRWLSFPKVANHRKKQVNI